jgi:hypothetical protein
MCQRDIVINADAPAQQFRDVSVTVNAPSSCKRRCRRDICTSSRRYRLLVPEPVVFLAARLKI